MYTPTMESLARQPLDSRWRWCYLVYTPDSTLAILFSICAKQQGVLANRSAKTLRLLPRDVHGNSRAEPSQRPSEPLPLRGVVSNGSAAISASSLPEPGSRVGGARRRASRSACSRRSRSAASGDDSPIEVTARAHPWFATQLPPEAGFRRGRRRVEASSPPRRFSALGAKTPGQLDARIVARSQAAAAAAQARPGA